MWTRENRVRYDRSGLRYETHLFDGEWAEIEPMLPPAKPGGNKRTVNLREVANGLMYILGTGCQWRAIPKDLAPRSTIYDYFDRWHRDGTLERIHHALYVKCREQASREASPTAAIIDAQSVKSAEKGGANVDPHGYDAGKKIKGKKRHVLVDTEGLVLHAIVVTAAEDRSAAGYHADCEIRSSPGRRFHRGRCKTLDRRDQRATVGMTPLAHETQQWFQRTAHFGERIFDLRRNLPIDLTMDQPIAFEFPKVKRQHPLGGYR